MMDIPNMQMRLEAHRFALQFGSEVDELFVPIEKFQKAGDAMKDATRFPQLLHFITRIGNELNGTDVKGIRITSFPKLQEYKTTTRPARTLLQYIVLTAPL
eukprot:Blabericola_migrator_1__10337@NODE_581_length_7493_cov_42_653919_g420_i1_p9_GENE_NODE_581_length_7493_cov_42_653919_g420_i1NODE_581_length_7493_cov_42_653919_g420_i1_p9_ORF_typecomplete_len101_score18_39FH2/PF02181_23/9_9e20_NODE_581_length_7493_cov_42_653919_g420_i170837385